MTSNGKQSLVDKATTENVVAAAVIIAVTGAGIYYGKWEVVSVIVGAAVGYLFPKMGA